MPIGVIAAGIGGIASIVSSNRAASAQENASSAALEAQTSEAALARAAQQEGTASAVNALQTYSQNANQQIMNGGAAIRDGFGQARSDVLGGEQSAIGALRYGRGQQVSAVNDAFQGQQGYLDPIVGRGDAAAGAYDYSLGIGDRPDNYTGYENTAYQNYIMDQTRSAVDGSAAANGGLFSGATIRAQQSNASGLAGQFYGDYLSRLSGVASEGNAARGALAGYAGQNGSALSNIYGNAASNIANTRTNAANTTAGLATGQGNALAGMFGDRASLQANTGSSLANIYSGQGSALAANRMALGDAGASAAYGAGNAQAAGAIGVGNAFNNGIGNALGAWQYGQQQTSATPLSNGNGYLDGGGLY